MEFLNKNIAQGVDLISVPASRFKTNEIAISFALPLDAENVSANALTVGLLSRKSREYPDMKSLNKKLARLYGAALSASVSKAGECQVLKLGLTALDDRFSLDGESIAFECVKLLTSLVFRPRLDEDGCFYDEDLASEKRILIEKIAAETNEKRVYVLRKAEELMFESEPYGINKYGTVAQVERLTTEDVLASWNNILSSAKVLVTVVGNSDFDKISQHLTECFAKIERNFKSLPSAVFVPECKSVKEKTERIDVKQGKLVLGFRVNLKPDDSLAPAMRTFCDVFGGGPYSKLFANVREKMSLCYYCSARYTRLKSCIMIQCGCNEENMDKAVNEILNQLEEIKKGNFDEELASSKLALRDALMSVNDAPEIMENWYSTQITDSIVKSPEMSVQENNSVTKEQVQKCATLLTLDTVYKLASEKEAE
ncbi:MAG: EF-P 5-aminopentanol modification-associated protein YfmF [Eubacterium sp.]